MDLRQQARLWDPDMLRNKAHFSNQESEHRPGRAAYCLADPQAGEALVEQLGFAGHRYTVVETLSGGTRQKLNLTVALMHDPDVILLDEPYQGFDWETYLRFWGIAERSRRDGRTIVVISHLFFERGRFDRLLRLRDGVLAAEGPM